MKKRYIKQLDMELSPLGFGIMRLPMENDGFPEKVYRLLDCAIDKGINYFDTAYFYQNGRSEMLIREALVKNYPRNNFYIADKLPVWECKNEEDMERIFQIQLERLGVDFIDFYLLHGLHKNQWEEAYDHGVLNFIERKRREGFIHKAGFSLHDTADVLKQIEQKYDWDFVQLQINYYDWKILEVEKSYQYLVEKNIPCMVMEPVGGGRLSKLPQEAERILKNIYPDESISSWAMKYVAALSNVAVTLSGMNEEEQLLDNVRQFEKIEPMTEQELCAIDQVVEIIHGCNTVPCSCCRYCVDECPKGVDIPQIFKWYNDYRVFENGRRFDIDYFVFVSEEKRGDHCIQCGRCSKKCPQKIDIPIEIGKIHNFAIGLSVGGDALKDYLEEHKGKKIVCFGSGAQGKIIKKFLQSLGYGVAYFCDNAESKWGTFVEDIEVISPYKLKTLYEVEEVVVLVTSSYHKEITKQLENMGLNGYVCGG